MKKKVKKEKLDIRLDAAVKKKLMERAERLDMTLSSYVRELLSQSGNKKGKSDILINIYTVEVQEILNYIQEKYDMDEKLERMVNRLWENMTN